MSFADRISAAVTFETQLPERFQAVGWWAFRFGQGLFSDEQRIKMRSATNQQGHPCLLRWMPDLIAGTSAGHVVLVDAKAWTPTSDKTGNIAIELQAIAALEVYRDGFKVDVYFACAADRDAERVLVFTPDTVRALCEQRSYVGYGSGTPFVVIAKTHGVLFEDVFKQPSQTNAVT